MTESVARELSVLHNLEIGHFTVICPSSRRHVREANVSEWRAALEFDACHRPFVHHILIREAPASGFRFRRCLNVSADSLGVIGALATDGPRRAALRVEDTFESKFINLEDKNIPEAVSFATWMIEFNNYVHGRGRGDVRDLPEDWRPVTPGLADPLRGVEWLFVEDGELFTAQDLLGLGRGIPHPSNENTRPFD